MKRLEYVPLGHFPIGWWHQEGEIRSVVDTSRQNKKIIFCDFHFPPFPLVLLALGLFFLVGNRLYLYRRIELDSEGNMKYRAPVVSSVHDEDDEE